MKNIAKYPQIICIFFINCSTFDHETCPPTLPGSGIALYDVQFQELRFSTAKRGSKVAGKRLQRNLALHSDEFFKTAVGS